MAKKQFTENELKAMKKPELQELAAEFHIATKGLKKQQIVSQLLQTAQIEVAAKTPLPRNDSFGTPEHPPEEKPTIQPMQDWQFQLEMERMRMERDDRAAQRDIEREDRAAQREFESQREREQREHEWRLAKLQQAGTIPPPPPPPPPPVQPQFRIENATKLLPKLTNEQEIETYLISFERIATLNKWPKTDWSAILQTQLKGKGLKVFSELPLADCQNYDCLKRALLTAYEVCPEVYRKKFRTLTKLSSDTYSDYAFKLSNVFKRWLVGINAYSNVNALREAMMMERFTEGVSEDLRLWLVDQKPTTLNNMAHLADQYVALRRSFPSEQQPEIKQEVMSNTKFVGKPPFRQFPFKQQTTVKPPIRCFFCKRPNHTISECRAKKRFDQKQQTQTVPTQPTTNLLIAANSAVNEVELSVENTLSVLPLHPLFAPFCSDASVHSVDGTSVHIRVLRDTAALQSLIRRSSIPPSFCVDTGEVRLLKGISANPVEVPLVEIHLETEFLNEKILCGLIDDLPTGVDFLLGNDLWFQAHPLPDVSFDAVVTRAQTTAATRVQDNSQLQSDTESTDSPDIGCPQYGDIELTSVKSAEEFKALQKSDTSLVALRDIVEFSPFPSGRSYFYIKDDMLFHHAVQTKRKREAEQIVVPRVLRNKVLFLAHDIPASGHLGIAKTESRIWPHFYWPHLSKEINSYCRSCDKCQRLGKGPKPAQAPLIPLPLVEEPFTRVAIDIVGPLPTCPKTGNRFILTVLDLATHYPEAIPLPDHTAQRVAQALTSVFGHFGFPKEILSDQGPDLMSELMQIFLHDFNIVQIKTSAYHPQTNGSVERFHRTLKSMIRANVDKFPDAWDDSLPLLLFAYREIPVETLGFSPFEMLFGYSVRGPLELLKSAWKPTSLTKSKPKQNVLQYILGVREKLNVCRELALAHAKEEKVKSKTWYDRKALERSFEPEQLVLVCLPSMGHPLETKYVGPYRIMERLGPVDYLISTPDRRKTQRICHVNMLKAYVTRDATLFPPQTINMTSVSLTIPVDEKEVITDFGPSAYDKDVGDIQGDLSPDQRSEVDQLLAKYAKTFDDKPGRTNLCKHVIELQPNTKPIRMAPYRVNPQKAECIRKELELMLELGVIERSNSPWASPVVLVPKPDGSVRFCADMRKLNDVTIADAYPMPRIDDLIDKVGGAKFLTKIDLSRGYWQVPMDEASIPISAFVTPHGHFQWRYMPFGLRNAPATFQKLVQQVLSGLESFTGSYLDDIIIFSNSWSEHLRHIEEVLKRIQSAGLTLKRTKCVFATAQVEFLGHTVGLGQVAPRQKTVQALLHFPRPTNRKQLRSYLGLAGYYRKFIPHFADLAASLNNLLRKGVRFTWTPETESSFLDLKSRLVSRPILRPPNFKQPFSLSVDASGVAIGACLFQTIDGVEHPVCYYSRKLDIHQQRYSTVEREALGLVLAVRVFSVYFGSQPTTVYTDHSPLQFIQRMALVNNKLLRWSLELQQYNLKIVHRAGKDNLLPDILSRPPH